MAPRRLRSSPELLVLVMFSLWTLVPLSTLLGHRGVFNGGYGLDLADLMQYMAFIRDSGEHLLISNRFDVAPSQHLLLDPGFALSGLLWRLGASIQLALLIWVPISMVAVFAGFSLYARRLLEGDPKAIAAALLIALFFLTPATPLADWLHGGPVLRFGTEVVGLEAFAGAYAWGTVPALAIALVPVFLLLIERALEPARRAPGRSARWYAGWAGLCGLLSAWLHPWQGLTLLVIAAGLVVWERFARRCLALAVPVALTAAPLAYYVALSKTKSAFGVAGHPAGYSHVGWWFVLSLAPLLLALPGYRGPARDPQERLLRIWPLAALAVYFALDRTWFYHALGGLTLPASILAVRGWRRARLPRGLGVALAVAVTVPGLIWTVTQLLDARGGDFFRAGEAQALAYLDRAPRPGAVLAPVAPLGQAVPAFTGRHTYVGHYEWTPAMAARSASAQALFDGRLSSAQAVALVRASGVAFLASDCSPARVDLRPLLGSLIAAEHRFGCATVYELRSPGSQAHTSAPSAPRTGAVRSSPAPVSARATVASASSPGP